MTGEMPVVVSSTSLGWSLKIVPLPKTILDYPRLSIPDMPVICGKHHLALLHPYPYPQATPLLPWTYQLEGRSS